MIEPVRCQAPLRDGEMSYLEWAGAGAPFHFAHANGFNARTYRTILASLARDLHVLACDQRGHGFSNLPAAPGQARDWTVFRDDLIAFLDCLGDAPVILAGHSMGATVSLMAAAAAPERVAGLVLFEPVLIAAIARDNDGASPDLATRALKRRPSFPSFESARDAYRGRGIFQAWSEAMLEDYLRGGLKPVADGTWELACTPVWESECFRSTPLGIAGLATHVRCPVAIVYGTVGSTSMESEIAAFARLRPDTRVLKIEGASHFLPMEHPRIVADEIGRMARFL